MAEQHPASHLPDNFTRDFHRSIRYHRLKTPHSWQNSAIPDASLHADALLSTAKSATDFSFPMEV